ncbi:MFS transporter [Psychrobacter sanguinis]|uniref:MFS transporter n=1 Tax=Psychrobacter sanguinis TaxID=861445 RepID=UPI00191A96E8|nr:MFS transporter [Psychrobacter sanguinis]MCC3307369.1 MFS transporter [Psychrobacter sanguinis]MCC3344807.1 MFS transporter [Psychrobacter sanguinis]MDY3305242.1 MFS transporter [Psychrobacter sanguinis]UEC24706.1 MFS transporter [Psychrobacter sanguinis]
MASQFSLFRSRRFTPMFFTQFLGAFNDNFFKQALLLLLTYSAAAKLGSSVSLLNNLAAMLFILPFFLFSALAGQLADKYEKSRLTWYIKVLEVVIMVLATFGLIFEIYWLLFVALFLLGAQSTFFGPIKYAYLPQAMHQDELVGANALFQTGTSLSILMGMMVAGLFIQMDNHLYWVSAMALLIASLGLLASKFIPSMPAVQPNMKIDWNIWRTSMDTIKYLYSLPLLFFIIIGNSWFWFYGATFLTQTPEFSKVILNGNESVVIFLLTLFSVGVAIGSLLCKTLTKNQVSFRLLPFGIAGLSLFAIDLYFSLSGLNIDSNTLLGISELSSVSGSWRVFADLFLLGFSGGIYIVPLYAAMQAYSPVTHGARVIGANNIFNAIFMVTSAIFSIVILNLLQLSLPQLFLVTGLLNIMFGIFLYSKLKRYKDTMKIQQDTLM